jgi:hypothetical protein
VSKKKLKVPKPQKGYRLVTARVLVMDNCYPEGTCSPYAGVIRADQIVAADTTPIAKAERRVVKAAERYATRHEDVLELGKSGNCKDCIAMLSAVRALRAAKKGRGKRGEK